MSQDLKTMIKGNRFLVVGRVGLDFYAEPTGSSLEDADVFRPVLGGSAGNIAAGLARMGNQVSMFSKLPDDAMGRRVRKEMKAYGIADDYVSTTDADTRTSIHFAENRMEGNQVVLYRNGAADFELDVDDVKAVDLGGFDAVILTGTALAREPSRGACLAMLDAAHAHGVARVIDLDYRAPTWQSAEEAQSVYRKASEACEIVIGNDVEFGVMAGDVNHGLALARELGKTRLVIYKMGEEGAIAIDHGEESLHGIFPVEALKPIGAGDAFMAAFATKLADQSALGEAMDFGAAHAAMVVAREGCAPAMQSQDGVQKFLDERR